MELSLSFSDGGKFFHCYSVFELSPIEEGLQECGEGCDGRLMGEQQAEKCSMF